MVTKCRCGWIIPTNSAVFRMGTNPSQKNIVQGYYIGLHCPQCDKKHTLVNADDPGAFMEMQRQKKESAKDGGN